MGACSFNADVGSNADIRSNAGCPQQTCWRYCLRHACIVVGFQPARGRYRMVKSLPFMPTPEILSTGHTCTHPADSTRSTHAVQSSVMHVKRCKLMQINTKPGEAQAESWSCRTLQAALQNSLHGTCNWTQNLTGLCNLHNLRRHPGLRSVLQADQTAAIPLKRQITDL